MLLNREFLHECEQYTKIFVGYSGGLDSSVLLHNLTKYQHIVPKIIAIHINHGLSKHAAAWAEHCKHFCQQLNIDLQLHSLQLKVNANIENTARTARYQIFAQLVQNQCLVLGHHLEDQAETVLLHLFRGAGINGLSAMATSKSWEAGHLFRPLLHCTRQQLKMYAQHYQLNWIEDESNANLTFTRNYLRHMVIPSLNQRWPQVIKNLHQTSNHCKEAQKNLTALAHIDCPELALQSKALNISKLSLLNHARIANVLQAWFSLHNLPMPNQATFTRIITEVIAAKSAARPMVAWANICLRRYQNTLYILPRQLPQITQTVWHWNNFPAPLELGNLGCLAATPLATVGIAIAPHQTIQIKLQSRGAIIKWHGQTKVIKKLWQQWQIPPWQRDYIPFLYIDGIVAAVIGYAISDKFFCPAAGNSNYTITWRGLNYEDFHYRS